MINKTMKCAVLTAPLLLSTIACASGGIHPQQALPPKSVPSTHPKSVPGSVKVTITGTYDKQDYPGTTLVTKPTRYALAAIHDRDGKLLDSDYLDQDGKRNFYVPKNANFTVTLYADIQVPKGKDYVLHGCVLETVPQARYTYGQYKQEYSDRLWRRGVSAYRTSDQDCQWDLGIEADEQSAGAFAIADQMVEFAKGIQRLDSGLMLADFTAYWSKGTREGLPKALQTRDGGVLVSDDSKSPILAAQLPMGHNWQSVAFNDSYVMEMLTRSLFAHGSSWSSKTGKTTFSSLIRMDNDNARTDFAYAAEPSAAFINGYSHFLACAICKSPKIYDVESKGKLVDMNLEHGSILFRGSRPASPLNPAEKASTACLFGHRSGPRSTRSPESRPVYGGEFYWDSVAKSLWGIWKNLYQCSDRGLQFLWDATVANRSNEYGNTALACYPTYLVGLGRLTGYPAILQTELHKHDIGKTEKNQYDVMTPAGPYYSSDALWVNGLLPVMWKDQVLTLHSDAVYYDWDQAIPYRVSCRKGQEIHVTLTATHPLLLEVFDTKGFLTYKEGSSQSFTLKAYEDGDHVIRVRVDPFLKYSKGKASYTLSIQ